MSPALVISPTTEPSVSKTSKKSMVTTHTQRSGVSSSSQENWQKSGAGDAGRQNSWSGMVVTPTGMPMSVVMTMERSSPPRMRSMANVPAKVRPSRNSMDEGLIKVCMWLKTVPSASSPLFLKPIMAMKKPMPTAMAFFSEAGIISKMSCRRLLTQSSTKSMPSRNTAVRANCHE